MVTPYAGVWIEMGDGDTTNTVNTVTPYAGVWIEICSMSTLTLVDERHSLRGSVD